MQEAMRRGRDRARMERPAPAYPDALPLVRRIVVVIDLDSGRPLIRMWHLLRSGRVDCYRVRGPGAPAGRTGWARALAAIRESYCRLSSPTRYS